MPEFHFNPEHAKQYGVPEAIMINNFQFWIAKNKANKKHQYDGRTWTYNSHDAFAELFVFWSKTQIKRILSNLVDKGVLVKGNYNTQPFDKTCWYAFVNEQSMLPNRPIHQSNSTDGWVEIDTPIPDIKPNIKPNNNYNHKTRLQEIDALWRPIAERFKLANIVSWTDKREGALKARLKEHNLTAEQFFDKIGDIIGVSPWLQGIKYNQDLEKENTGWRADIDFFLSPSGCVKTLEGKYIDRDLLRHGEIPKWRK